MRLQALVDKKKVIIMKATIIDALHLDDAEGVECLPNEEIFAELARMGYEKPSTKLTFYKAFFSCKGFSRVDTHLFEGMILEQPVGEGADEVHDEGVSTAGVAAEGDVSAANDVVPTTVEEPSISSPTPPTQPPQPLQAQSFTSQGRVIADMDADVDVTLKDVVAVVKDGQDAKMEEKPAELKEVVKVFTTAKLITEVVTAASTIITAAAPQLTTAAVLTLTTAPSATRRRKGVVIRDPEETATPSTIFHSESKSKYKGKGILKANNAVKRYQALKRKPQTKAQARKNMMIYLRNVAGFKMDNFKGMTYDDIRLIFEKKFNSNVAFLLKTNEQIDKEDSSALKRLSESQDDKTAKKQKLDEEVEELKRYLQIVPNDEDDVYTKATPLARKVPVVDYEIYTETTNHTIKSKELTPRWENDMGKLFTTPDSLRGRNHKRSKQHIENSNLEEQSHPIVTMTDNRTMAEMLRAPTEGYKDLLRACPHHGFTKLHKLDTFYNALNPADQDSLNAAAGGNLLERKIPKLTHAVNQQTNAVTTAITAILKQFQATHPPTLVKAVEETCVTYGGAHPYYQCLAAGGNTFLEFRDNIQGYVLAAVVNYNQGNPGYRPLGSGCLPSNTVANSKGELKAITTRSGLVIDGPTVPTPSRSINPEEDERVEETFTDPDLVEYTIKVPPPPAKKYKPPSKKEFVVHKRDPLHPNISYPTRMLKQKQQEKVEVQIHKFWQMFKQLHINITLADALILMPKYQKMLKALLSNKEKLQELANTPLNENFSAKLDLPELIPTHMTLELANHAICTPAGITRDVFVPIGKFTFPTDFVIVDYESNPRVPLILGRPILRTARALIDVHGVEMILRDGDERLTLNMRHDTSSYSNQPQKESINLINVFNNSSEDFLEDLGMQCSIKEIIDLDSIKDLHPPFKDNPLSGSTTYLLEEFADELPPEYDDNLQFDIKSDLKEIEFLLYQDKDSSLKDSIDQKNHANLANISVDSIPAMFTDEHTLDYSSPPIFDVYDDDFLEVRC
nr:hypothetical protein [Tanacetum cinerariifolium]